MIDLSLVLANAEEEYRKVRGRGMESEQIKALAKALVDAVNEELDYLRRYVERVNGR